MENNELIQILLLGTEKVGKSDFKKKFNYKEKTPGDYIETTCINRDYKSLYINGKFYNIAIWDTVGKNQFQKINISFCKRANIALILYNPFDEKSKELSSLIELVLDYFEFNTTICLIRSKCDLDFSESKNGFYFSDEEAIQLCEKYNLLYFHYSLCDMSNKQFSEMIKIILNDYLLKKNNKKFA